MATNPHNSPPAGKSFKSRGSGQRYEQTHCGACMPKNMKKGGNKSNPSGQSSK